MGKMADGWAVAPAFRFQAAVVGPRRIGKQGEDKRIDGDDPLLTVLPSAQPRDQPSDSTIEAESQEDASAANTPTPIGPIVATPNAASRPSTLLTWWVMSHRKIPQNANTTVLESGFTYFRRWVSQLSPTDTHRIPFLDY